mgnify:CR=1 FL=1
MIRLALRNIFRHKTRSLITLSAIAFGCVSLIFVGGFFEDILFKMRESYIKAHTGHLQIYRRGFLTEGRRNPYAYLIEQPQEVVRVTQHVPGIATVTQRLEFAGLLSTGETTMSCLGQGVEAQHEPTVRLSDPDTARPDVPLLSGTVIEQGEALREDQPFGIIVGRGLAESIAARPGDGLIVVAHTVGGSINALDVIVRGIFYTSSQAFDDHYVRLPLVTAQRLLHTQAAQTLVVLLDRTEDTPRVKRDLEQLFQAQRLDLELRTWDELSDFYTKTKAFFIRLFFVLKLVIAIIATLSIYNTMNMAVLERTTEIGTIMALGLKRRRVLWLFLCEGGLLGVFGGSLGLLAGTTLTWAISRVGIPMPPPPGATFIWHSEPLIDPGTLIFAFGLSLVTALLSSWYPAQKASRLEIAQALRHA